MTELVHTHGGPECTACIQGWVVRVEEYRTRAEEAEQRLARLVAAVREAVDIMRELPEADA